MAEYQRLKQKAEQLQRDADRAEGTLQAAEQRFVADFGCGLDEAASLDESLAQEETQLARQCEEAVAKLRTDFPQMTEE